MDKKNSLKIFKDKKIRTIWDEYIGNYWYSVKDVIVVLTDSKNPRKYWSVLKTKINDENQLTTICSQLKLPSHKDGKFYKTDAATIKQLLRIIQSVSSSNVEPFKQWLNQIGSERLDEVADLELSMQRAVETYRKKGYSEEWIEQRLQSIMVRKDLTAEWNSFSVELEVEYAILTDEITKAWSGKTTKEYKNYKRLRKESLRDNMAHTELILNILGEVTYTERMV